MFQVNPTLQAFLGGQSTMTGQVFEVIFSDESLVKKPQDQWESGRRIEVPSQ